MFSSFDNLDKEILNLNDVVIKDLQVESQRLCNKINNLEKKQKKNNTNLISLEENSNFLEQYVKGITLKSLGLQVMSRIRTLRRK